MYLKRTSTKSQAILASKPSITSRATLYIGTRYVRWSHKSGGPGTMGRFGGGWNIKFGIAAGSAKGLFSGDFHLDLFVATLSFGKQGKYDNEAKAREIPAPPLVTDAQAQALAVGLTTFYTDIAKETTHAPKALEPADDLPF